MDTFAHYLEVTARVIENIFLIIGTIITSAGTIETIFRRFPTATPMSFIGWLGAKSARAGMRIQKARPVLHALARFFSDLDAACDNLVPQKLLAPKASETEGSANRPDSPE